MGGQRVGGRQTTRSSKASRGVGANSVDEPSCCPICCALIGVFLLGFLALSGNNRFAAPSMLCADWCVPREVPSHAWVEALIHSRGKQTTVPSVFAGWRPICYYCCALIGVRFFAGFLAVGGDILSRRIRQTDNALTQGENA